jgi:hypothetical protein
MRWIVASGALLAAITVAGCGSSYSKADFISRADAICETAFRQTHTIAPPAAGGGAAQQLTALASYLQRVTPVVESETSDLSKLRRPAADRALLERYLAALRAAVAQYRELGRAAAAGDVSGVAEAESALAAGDAQALAARYGLRSCGDAGATVA